VDGKTVGYSGVSGPFKPGQEQMVVGGDWTATDGPHLLRCVLDDINRLPGEPKGNNISEMTFVVGIPGQSQILGSTQAAPGSVDLSEEGKLDWVHWGLGDKNSLNRRTGANLIEASLIKNGEGYCDKTLGCPVSMRWTGGSPTVEMKDTHAGLWWNGVGTSQSFSVPATASDRILRVYVAGIEGMGGTFTAKLSDNSAPPYVSTLWDGNAALKWSPVPGGFSAVYEIRYRAASPGQKLLIEWKLSSEPNSFRGQARLQAATLSQ
jgi:hypothetical protein